MYLCYLGISKGPIGRLVGDVICQAHLAGGDWGALVDIEEFDRHDQGSTDPANEFGDPIGGNARADDDGQVLDHRREARDWLDTPLAGREREDDLQVNPQQEDRLVNIEGGTHLRVNLPEHGDEGLGALVQEHGRRTGRMKERMLELTIEAAA